jgi:Uncharacterized protein conserved in bacteria
MATHLLADVHLTGADDPNAARLSAYLDGPAREAEAVYVLGDLFDVWIGDDGSLPEHAAVIDRFAALARTDVPLYFIRGNRDFAVGEAFVAASHMQILDDPIVVDLHGTPTLLSHGDVFCTDDTAHQKISCPLYRPTLARAHDEDPAVAAPPSGSTRTPAQQTRARRPSQGNSWT